VACCEHSDAVSSVHDAEFEAKLKSTKDPNFEWRDALIPNSKTILLVKPGSKRGMTEVRISVEQRVNMTIDLQGC